MAYNGRVENVDFERAPLEKQRWWQRAGVRPRDVLTWLVLAAVCLVVIWNLAGSIWRNYQMRQDISAASDEVNQLKLEKERLQSLLVYYNSRSFQEIELRRHFLLKKPDEVVVALRSGQPQAGVATPTELAPEEETAAPQDSGWRRWWRFYFGSAAPEFSVQTD